MNVTLLEVQLPDAQFNAPFSGRATTAAEDADAEREPADGPASRLGPFVVLAGVVGLVWLARYLRGGEGEQTTLDEVAV